MTLLDFDTHTDVDLSEMMERVAPCEFPQLVVGRNGVPPSWCTEVATHWVRITCRRCGQGCGRVLVCLPCAKFLRQGLRIVGVVISPWIRHDGCRRPGIFRVTSGAL